MKKISFLFFLLLLSLIVATSVSAHVRLDYPLGGETFVVGDKVRIQWVVEQQHNQENWDLYFSSDGGINWVELKFDLELSQLEYLWTVPQIVTEKARIKVIQDNIEIDYVDTSRDFTITDEQTSVEPQNKIPAIFKLHTNYPNPFNPTTTINYDLPSTMNAELSVYNLLGQKVATLFSGRQNAGYHSVVWDASQLSAGAYFIKLQADEFIQLKKSILLK